jgi:predicted amidohydrolase
MNIFAVQLDLKWEDKSANFARARDLLAKTPPSEGSLVVLPEMFSTGFSMDTAKTRQGREAESEAFLAELAQTYRAYVVGGVVSGEAQEKARNEAVVVSPAGATLARYQKIHPFSLGGEADAHEAGQNIVTFDWSGLTVAPFICYDLRFPEIFRAAATRGVGMFVVIALWPAKRQQHWLTLLQARAIENQAYVVGVNRVGAEPLYSYAGRSVVVDPHGVIIADAGEQERVLATLAEASAVDGWRRDFPALRDAHWPGRAVVKPPIGFSC